MNMPGFNAESSLGTNEGVYRGMAGFGGNTGAIRVAPAQLGPLSGLFETTRCCQWSPMFRRFVCSSRRHPPWVHCRCIRTLTAPVIICDDPVISGNL
jgi:hypothetical protein